MGQLLQWQTGQLFGRLGHCYLGLVAKSASYLVGCERSAQGQCSVGVQALFRRCNETNDGYTYRKEILTAILILAHGAGLETETWYPTLSFIVTQMSPSAGPGGCHAVRRAHSVLQACSCRCRRIVARCCHTYEVGGLSLRKHRLI